MWLKDTEYIKDWDWDRNNEIGLYGNSITTKSNHYAYWICKEHGHSYSQAIYSHTNGAKCPYCSGRKVLSGFNDLKTKFPELANEWDYINNDIKPDIVSPNSHKKYYWICNKCGSGFQQSVQNRTKNKSGCPICAKEKRTETYLKTIRNKRGNLLDSYPELLQEWDYEKNNISPNEITYGSKKKAFWICKKCGNKYESCISNRTLNGSGCPVCAKREVNTKKTITRIKNGDETLSQYLINKNVEWDYEKNKTTPDKVLPYSNNKYSWICKICGCKFEKTAARIVTSHNSCPKCKLKYGTLLDYSPVICNEWDYKKNINPPTMYSAFSQKKVYWICSVCGESYIQKIQHRTRFGTGCPKCNMSHGERIVLCFLNEEHIKYFSQYKFDDCVSVSQLPFDFYLPEYNIAIEYDGDQHHKPVDRFGGEEAFEELKKRDKIKDDYCKEHGIKLIRLTEKNPDKLFEILHNTIFANK